MANERASRLGILDLEVAVETDLRAVEVREVGKNLPWVITIDSSADVIPSNHGQDGDNLRFNHLLVRNPDLVQFDLSLHAPALIVLNPDATTLSVRELVVVAPVVVVVARQSRAADHVEEMYEEGATVVLDKLSDPRILNATVNEVLKRSLTAQENGFVGGESADNTINAPKENPIIGVGALELDLERFETKYNGNIVKLTAKEWDIVVLLAKNKGKLLSAQTIVESVTEHGYDKYADGSLRVMIYNIRGKMPGLVKTIRKRGYKIDSPSEDQS